MATTTIPWAWITTNVPPSHLQAQVLKHPRPPQKTRREPQAPKFHHSYPFSAMASTPLCQHPFLSFPHSPPHPLMPPTQTPPLSPRPILLMSLQLPPPSDVSLSTTSPPSSMENYPPISTPSNLSTPPTDMVTMSHPPLYYGR